MDKDKAIEIARNYIKEKNSRQPVSIDTRDVLDENPVEFKEYWCFKSYYYNMNSMRPDGLWMDTINPYFIISKETKEIIEINSAKYKELEKL